MKSKAPMIALLALIALSATLMAFVLPRREAPTQDISVSNAGTRVVPTPESPAEPVRRTSFPDSWYIYGSGRPDRLRALENQKAPVLSIGQWYDDELDLQNLEGKILVVDFWATWCGPCVQALPKNVKLAEKYRDQGVVFLGIHDARRGWERVSLIHKRYGINYAIGQDDRGSSARNWKVSFWPTYAVIDGNGVARAVGLTATHVEDVIKVLLAETDGPPLAAAAPSTDPAPLFNTIGGVDMSKVLEGTAQDRARLTTLYQGDPPSIDARGWINSPSLNLEDLKGKVVLLDFWATWCRPCIGRIPELKRLHETYAGDGLVVVGVCHPRQADQMGRVVKQHGIPYPVCEDVDARISTAYKVNGFPDYYLIDRQGRLRLADVKNDSIEEAIKALLAEGRDVSIPAP